MVLHRFRLAARRSAGASARQAKQRPDVVAHAHAHCLRVGVEEHHLGAVQLRALSLAGESQRKRRRNVHMIASNPPSPPRRDSWYPVSDSPRARP
jgi:hypothetical protein